MVSFEFLLTSRHSSPERVPAIHKLTSKIPRDNRFNCTINFSSEPRPNNEESFLPKLRHADNRLSHVMSNTRIQNTGVAGVQELQNADRAARPFIVRAGPLIRKEFT